MFYIHRRSSTAFLVGSFRLVRIFLIFWKRRKFPRFPPCSLSLKSTLHTVSHKKILLQIQDENKRKSRSPQRPLTQVTSIFNCGKAKGIKIGKMQEWQAGSQAGWQQPGYDNVIHGREWHKHKWVVSKILTFCGKYTRGKIDFWFFWMENG